MPEFLTGLWLRPRALFLRRKLERDLDEELGFHLLCANRSWNAAARRRLENPTLRFACRPMAAAPVFTAVAAATLALGIGANMASFSIVHNVLLREMPYEIPADLDARSFQAIAAMMPTNDTLLLGAESVSYHK
jgi:hypothetical protein